MAKTTENFIQDARKIHGNKYNYSKVEYINSTTKITITCPIHGDFEQTPHNHLRKRGCPQCGREQSEKKRRLGLSGFIEQAQKVHGNEYDYSKVEYINNCTKVTIICPIHGDFEQTPSTHLQGKKCPLCGNLSRKKSNTTDYSEVLSIFKTIHNDKYDYSKVNYVNQNTPIKIICPTHGEFEQKPILHKNGYGCPKCGIETNSEQRRLGNATFIERAKEIHGDKYDYTKVEYLRKKNNVILICPIHGEFEQTPDNHLRGMGCPKCGIHLSKGENEIYEFIKKLIGEENVVRHDRTLLQGREIDIYIPSLKLGIEYDGLIWHSELSKKDKNYHLSKTNDLEKQGIRLIHIYEDEFQDKKEIVLAMIKHVLKCDYGLQKIYARKCTIREIDKHVAKEFLNKYHIQGYKHSTITIGAFNGEELVSVMTFLKRPNDSWELNRYATKTDYRVIGIASKLLKHFTKNYNYETIVSFLDRRRNTSGDSVYEKIGFTKDCDLPPSYDYVMHDRRYHKFNFRKTKLNKKYGLPIAMSENEMCKAIGAYKIWNCGLVKYIYKKEEHCQQQQTQCSSNEKTLKKCM